RGTRRRTRRWRTKRGKGGANGGSERAPGPPERPPLARLRRASSRAAPASLSSHSRGRRAEGRASILLRSAQLLFAARAQATSTPGANFQWILAHCPQPLPLGCGAEAATSQRGPSRRATSPLRGQGGYGSRPRTPLLRKKSDLQPAMTGGPNTSAGENDSLTANLRRGMKYGTAEPRKQRARRGRRHEGLEDELRQEAASNRGGEREREREGAAETIASKPRFGPLESRKTKIRPAAPASSEGTPRSHGAVDHLIRITRGWTDPPL
ncbi:unnamed protein product, partial [Prorocentrum cordatum]